MRPYLRLIALTLAADIFAGTAAAQTVKGLVQGGGAPSAGSTVTLWAASAGAPAGATAA